jgi:hypothetical protein
MPNTRRPAKTGPLSLALAGTPPLAGAAALADSLSSGRPQALPKPHTASLKPGAKTVAQGLGEALLALRNPDGGWGYYTGKSSRVEPTCWALLALARQAGTPIDIAPLRGWARQEDWLVDAKGAPINYAFNALAALTLLQNPDGEALARQITGRLVTAKGVRLEQTDALRQDNSLQAWPWIDQTFSWVEPTAYCLLLLKKMRQAPGAALPAEAGERITVGERMLLDRACQTGGWNYGGSNVYGQELWAYVPTTALALLAMQDRRDDPIVGKSLQYLQKDAATERSAPALALSLICLRVFGVQNASFEKELIPRLDLSRALGSTVALAMSLYALAETRHGMDAFSL